VSEKIQRGAAERRDAARRRAANARARAEKQEDPELERLHRRSADLQESAAEDAEALRLADVAIEGDQLNK
jgi:hypothetical protein